MTTEDAIRLELVNLLRYANKTAIASALGVSAQTVINWSEGKHPSQTRLDQVRALYGLPVASGGNEKEGAEPEWVQRLEARLIELRANQDVVARAATQNAVEALLTPEMAEWRDQIAAAMAALPMPASEATDDPADTRAQDTQAPLGQ